MTPSQANLVIRLTISKWFPASVCRTRVWHRLYRLACSVTIDEHVRKNSGPSLTRKENS